MATDTTRAAGVHRRSRARNTARAIALALAFALGLAASQPSAAASAAEGAGPHAAAAIGVHYIPPALKPGASPRTPEGVEWAILERMHDQERGAVRPVGLSPDQAGNVVRTGGVALALAALPANAGLAWGGARVVPLGYNFGAMAIMRSDTDITRWEQLRGRKVCVAQGGWFAGSITSRFGAVEVAHPSPADALIGLRVGDCDAAVHDSQLLEELVKFPEWKKFSARLPVIDERQLAFLVAETPSPAYELARRTARQWRGSAFPRLVRQMAQNIAFEVYLDQDVPDCH